MKRIGVTGGEHLMRTLQNEIESVSFVRERADVNIEFEGRVTPLRLGRKRREGQGTVTRNGRVIFRYEMPAQEYRVGDTPAEAFTNVLVAALEEE